MRTRKLSTIGALAGQHRLFEWTLARALVAGGVPVRHVDAEGSWVETERAETLLSRLDLVELRATSRTDRLACRTSQRWVAGYPALVAEWHPTRNGDLFPDQVSFGSHARIWWKCAAGPDHEWQARPNGRTSGRGCPFCAGQRVSVTNSLESLRPDLARMWDPTKNEGLSPQDVTAQSHKRVWWRCLLDPEHSWRSGPAATTGCPFCAGKRLSPQRAVAVRAPDLEFQWHPRNELGPEEAFAGTQAVVWWRCARGHEWQASVRNRALRGHGCPTCANRPPEARTSLASVHSDLAAQWHPTKNGTLRPVDVPPGSRRTVWWKCIAGPDHEWSTSVANRVAGTNCPFCANQRVSITNALATRFPEVAAEWHPTRNGRLHPEGVVFGSSLGAWWRCQQGHVWKARVASRTRQGSGCPRCRHGGRYGGRQDRVE